MLVQGVRTGLPWCVRGHGAASAQHSGGDSCVGWDSEQGKKERDSLHDAQCPSVAVARHSLGRLASKAEKGEYCDTARFGTAVMLLGRACSAEERACSAGPVAGEDGVAEEAGERAHALLKGREGKDGPCQHDGCGTETGCAAQDWLPAARAVTVSNGCQPHWYRRRRRSHRQGGLGQRR